MWSHGTEPWPVLVGHQVRPQHCTFGCHLLLHDDGEYTPVDTLRHSGRTTRQGSSEACVLQPGLHRHDAGSLRAASLGLGAYSDCVVIDVCSTLL